MDNYFITKPPYGHTKSASPLLRLVNKGFRFLKFGYQVSPMDGSVDMNTVEQRMNYYHLLNNVISSNVSGDVVELGCFTGQCAVLFEKVLEQNKADKKLHLYDSFHIKFKEKEDIADVLIRNFKDAGLRLPILHKGFFNETLPSQLPESICFAHIDCGFGGDKMEHKAIMIQCLEGIYPRMSKGAICVLMDYNNPEMNGPGVDINPGVKLACDDFLKDKPEEMVALYGNQYYHAYFKKV